MPSPPAAPSTVAAFTGITSMEIRRWEDGGRGAYRDFKAADNSIMDLKALHDDSLLVAGLQPDWGRYGPDGQKIIYKRGEIADFKNKDFIEYFTLSRRGDKLSFKPQGGEAMVFSLADRSLAVSAETFQPYRDSGGGRQRNRLEELLHPLHQREQDHRNRVAEPLLPLRRRTDGRLSR